MNYKIKSVLCSILLPLHVFHIVFGHNPYFYFKNDEHFLTINSDCETSFRTAGYCKRVYDCPPNLFKLTNRDICYFERNNPVVCCERQISGFPILSPANFGVTTQKPMINFGATTQKSTTNFGVTTQKSTTNFGVTTQKSMTEASNEDSTIKLGPIYEYVDLVKGPDIIQNAPLNLPISDPSISDLPNFENDNLENDILARVRNSEKISDKKCIEYPIAINQPTTTANSNDDGESHILVVGGLLSKEKDNPQIAAIGWRPSGDTVDWKCGGTLISPNFIITAAHCTDDRGQAPSVVRVGDLNLFKGGDVPSQDATIVKMNIHPNYNPRLLYNDIALIEVSPNITFSEFVRPACLWSYSDVPVKDVIIMGYGTDAFAGAQTNELYEGNLTVVNNDDCRQTLGTNIQIPNGIIESQLCAVDPAGKTDTCQGDSGGPLVFRTGSGKTSNQHLVGITSFGEFCAGPTPGVYTRISSYIDWIESIVWPSN